MRFGWQESAFSTLLELTEEDNFEVLEKNGNSSAVVGRYGNRVIKVMDDYSHLEWGALSRLTNPFEPSPTSEHKKRVHVEAGESNRTDREYNFPEVIHAEPVSVTAEDVERFSWLDEDYEDEKLYVIETEFVSGYEPKNSEEIATAISEMHRDRIALRDFGKDNIIVNRDFDGEKHTYIVDLDYARFDASFKDIVWDKFVLSWTLEDISSEEISEERFRDLYGITDLENQIYETAYKIGKVALRD